MTERKYELEGTSTNADSMQQKYGTYKKRHMTHKRKDKCQFLEFILLCIVRNCAHTLHSHKVQPSHIHKRIQQGISSIFKISLRPPAPQSQKALCSYIPISNPNSDNISPTSPSTLFQSLPTTTSECDLPAS